LLKLLNYHIYRLLNTDTEGEIFQDNNKKSKKT